MTRWLAIATRDNARVVAEKHVWGVPRRSEDRIRMTQPGDSLLVYVGRQYIDARTTLPPAITGCFTIVSEVYEDGRRIFTAPPRLAGETFPFRVRLRPVRIFEDVVHFRPLIPLLRFITNKTKWSGHIRGQAMRTIPEEDFALILPAAETPRG
jgi:predicted RNA-binding protein